MENIHLKVYFMIFLRSERWGKEKSDTEVSL